MIYTDPSSVNDREELPGKRVDSVGTQVWCINCGYTHSEHHGWRCPTKKKSATKFSDLQPNERYLTNSMQSAVQYPNSHQATSNAATMCAGCGYAKIAHTTSLSGNNLICPTYGRIGYWTEPKGATSPIQKAQPKEVDISDWKAWAHNRPGECACGIPRERCTYHK